MADVNRGNRPLSPHISIWRWQLHAITSILHRASGVAMAVSALLIVWWFLGAATGEHYFAFVDGLLTSWLGILVMTLSAFGLWYHFCNGLRHLMWDMGFGFELEQVTQSAYAVIGAAAVLTLLTLVVAF